MCRRASYARARARDDHGDATSARLGALRSLERGESPLAGTPPRGEEGRGAAFDRGDGELLVQARRGRGDASAGFGVGRDRGSPGDRGGARLRQRAPSQARHPPSARSRPDTTAASSATTPPRSPPRARAIVPEPFGFDEPVAPEPRELPPTPVAPRAARVDDDARPPRLDVEDARPAPLGEIPPGTTDGARNRLARRRRSQPANPGRRAPHPQTRARAPRRPILGRRREPDDERRR